jgi:hypothetical protein
MNDKKAKQPHCCYRESFMVDETRHIFSLSQSLNHSRAPLPFSSVKSERDEEAAEEKFEASRDWLMKFKEKKAICIT